MRAQRRRALQAAYRRLLGASMQADAALGVDEVRTGASLTMYVRQRMRDEIEGTRRAALARGTGRTQLKAEAFARRLDTMEAYTEALGAADVVPEVAAAVRALSYGMGNEAFRLSTEASVLTSVQFRMDRETRQVGDDQAADLRQTRVLLQALLPFAEKLTTMHDPKLIASRDDAAMTVALSARRSTTRSQYVNLTTPRRTEAVYVETDDELSKQIVYVQSGDFDVDTNQSRVEVRELPNVRRCTAHREWSAVAERLLEVLRAETALHPSRATTVVGHGVGGAVAVCLAAMLQADGFLVRNVVTFGAPRVFSSLEQRSMEALNCIRVQLGSDRRVGYPVADDEGNPFLAFGEVVHLDASDASPAASSSTGTHGAAAATGEDGAEDDDVAQQQSSGSRDLDDPCSMQHYLAAMTTDGSRVEYYSSDADPTSESAWAPSDSRYAPPEEEQR
jgi:hypothetical protein